jgi:hypothetical protein
MYTQDKALKDFRLIATAAGADDEQIEEAIDNARRSDDLGGLAFLTDMFRELLEIDDSFEDFFFKVEGQLYQMTLATDEDCDYDIEAHLEGEALDVFKQGKPVAFHDADRWMLLEGNLFRVHPEGCTKLGPFLAYMQEQVDKALATA